VTKPYLLIGSGGTGSHALPVLIPYLTTFHGGVDREVWVLGVMDGDTVEEKNLERQLFEPAMVTMNKAEAATLPYRYATNVISIPHYLGADNIDKYIYDGVTIFIAVDNFPVRALIEDKVKTLENAVVINAGNEFDTGSCQVWIRKNGQDLTPPISFMHPEIRRSGAANRADMTCQEVAQLPGGEQLIVTNMASAMYMTLALMMVNGDSGINWTELQFDLAKPANTYSTDLREDAGILV